MPVSYADANGVGLDSLLIRFHCTLLVRGF